MAGAPEAKINPELLKGSLTNPKIRLITNAQRLIYNAFPPFPVIIFLMTGNRDEPREMATSGAGTAPAAWNKSEKRQKCL
jgi:hypothetical protein